MLLSQASEGDQRIIDRELEIAAGLHHPNIVRWIETCYGERGK